MKKVKTECVGIDEGVEIWCEGVVDSLSDSSLVDVAYFVSA